MNALIIDDDQIVCMLASRMLSGKGFTTSTVESEETLDSYLNSQPRAPDLILMDMQIGPLTGPEAHQKLTNSFGDKLPPIVMMSSHTEFELEELFSEFAKQVPLEGSFIQKPFKSDQLFELLTQRGIIIGETIEG